MQWEKANYNEEITYKYCFCCCNTKRQMGKFVINARRYLMIESS